MPTELMTRAMMGADSGRESPLRGIRSSQIATVRHDNLSFGDFVDMINPLHHIPIVSSFYQNATGDTISPVASLVGGGLLGGFIGFFGAAVNAIFQEATGNSLVGSVANAVMGAEEGMDTVSVASAASTTNASAVAHKKASEFYVKPTVSAASAGAGAEMASSFDMRI